MVEAELRQWKSVVEDIEARRSAYEEKAVGRRVIDDYDKESTRLADSVTPFRPRWPARFSKPVRSASAPSMKRSVARIQNAIAPYTRFVRAERDRLANAREDITRSAEEQSRLGARVEEL